MTQGVALHNAQHRLRRHVCAHAKFPRLRVMTAGAMVGTALAEHRRPDSRPVYNAVLYDTGQIKHGWKDRASPGPAPQPA